MKKKVISYKNRPSRLPLWEGIILWLVLDRLDAPDFARGIVWALYAVLVVVVLANFSQEEQVDIFKDNK